MIVEGVPPDQIHAYTDYQGFPSLIIDGSISQLLSVAFEHDIQTSDDATLLCERLESIESGNATSFIFSGNSSTVTISPSKVTIESDIFEGEESLEMSLVQYRVILEVWARHLGSLG